jgi:hypothetical protein
VRFDSPRSERVGLVASGLTSQPLLGPIDNPRVLGLRRPATGGQPPGPAKARLRAALAAVPPSRCWSPACVDGGRGHAPTGTSMYSRGDH